MSALTEAAVAAGGSDAQLIERSVACPEDFALIFDRHAASLHGYLRRRIGVPAADDLLAETFLIAFERRTRYDLAAADARPWLFGIATNLLRRFARAEARAYRALARTGVDRVAASLEDEVAERVDADAARRTLAAALAKLSRGDRDAILLYTWAELSYDQIAAALDIPTGTVRSRLHRARRRLRAALDHDLSEE
ncbi:MAG TPA: RNA polymerase sigma factor [Natronosporangium sp.]